MAGISPVSGVSIDKSAIDAMVAQMRNMAGRAQGPQALAADPLGLNAMNGAVKASSGGFAAALKASLDSVAGAQDVSAALGRKFALGDDSVNLSDVLIAGQKANLAFQATVQVRNKLVSAYQEMMSMQV